MENLQYKQHLNFKESLLVKSSQLYDPDQGSSADTIYTCVVCTFTMWIVSIHQVMLQTKA